MKNTEEKRGWERREESVCLCVVVRGSSNSSRGVGRAPYF